MYVHYTRVVILLPSPAMPPASGPGSMCLLCASVVSSMFNSWRGGGGGALATRSLIRIHLHMNVRERERGGLNEIFWGPFGCVQLSANQIYRLPSVPFFELSVLRVAF